ncbi:hypothetical protein R3P38DRAFT_2838839 [Favolaschia claudopus]|uniref:Uncharacterized protein n=1 Tax=Favolaschia claudopus TaxID=2862362 RepID=A0AAW0E894_9AGAR
MSAPGGQPGTFKSNIYQYALIGSVVVLSIFTLVICVYARRHQRNNPHLRLFGGGGVDIENKPRIYDTYLYSDKDGDGEEEAEAERWNDIMPVSFHPIMIHPPPEPTPAKSNSPPPTPLTSSSSTVLLLIAMPSPKLHHTHELADDDEHPIPPVEFGTREVEISSGVQIAH